MKSVAQLFILILAFLIINPAKAGVLIEPVLGYNLTTIDYETGSNDYGSGPAYGGRLGYQNLGFQLGIDYLRSSSNVSDSSYKSDLVSNEIAGFVGFEFPVMLRVYAGYIFSATADGKFDGGAGKQDLEFKDGSGMKFGVGFTGLPFVDINFEYRKSSFDEYKLGTTTYNSGTDFTSYMISLSLPFVL